MGFWQLGQFLLGLTLPEFQFYQKYTLHHNIILKIFITKTAQKILHINIDRHALTIGRWLLLASISNRHDLWWRRLNILFQKCQFRQSNQSFNLNCNPNIPHLDPYIRFLCNFYCVHTEMNCVLVCVVYLFGAFEYAYEVVHVV